MEIRFNATGAKRKELVNAVNELTGTKMEYKGVPTMCYENGSGLTISKAGTLLGEGITQELLDGLAERGFVDPENRTVETAGTETAGEIHDLTVELPKTGFNEEKLENLRKLVSSKKSLIKKALGTDDLTITETSESISFPWFKITGPEETEAYTKFVTALCETAKKKKRVNGTAKPTDNEKFTLRVFLIGLGLKGEDTKLTRKLLINKNLSGNSAYMNGGQIYTAKCYTYPNGNVEDPMESTFEEFHSLKKAKAYIDKFAEETEGIYFAGAHVEDEDGKYLHEHLADG